MEEKRGRYMDKWSPEKKKEYMAKLAHKKWSSVSIEDRKKFGGYLALSRKAKIIS